MELRALEKGFEERKYDAWCRARMIAHTVYINMPVFGNSIHKEADPRKWYPLAGDEKYEEEPEVIKITEEEIKELNRIKSLIK